MADRTAIEWTDATWNPVRGCTRVSEGCRHCYAETVAARFSDAGAPYHGFAERGRPGSKWTGRVEVIWRAIDLPLRWQRPRRIFVNSMSDLFHQSIDTEDLASIYAVMVAAVHLRGHTFQVLTKRPDHMRRVLAQEAFWHQVNVEAGAHVMERTRPLNRRSDDARATLDEYGSDRPPPCIWLGTSVENQPAADERIPHLLAAAAAVRFLSCEPLLAGIDLRPWLPGDSGCDECDDGEGMAPHHCSRTDIPRDRQCPRRLEVCDYPEGPPGDDGAPVWISESKRSVDWVIVGGESGPGARPMHPDWARSLRDQCVAAGVPFFFKQWGEWAPTDAHRGAFWVGINGGRRETGLGTWASDALMRRIGKAAAGAMLDGREWREMPR